MRKVEWIANDIFFDEHGRLHILNPLMVDRIKSMKTTSSSIEINQASVIIGPIPIPGPSNPTCPDGMCVCRRDKINITGREQRTASRTKAATRSRKPSSGI